MVVVAGMAACIFCGNNIAYNYDRLSTSFYIAFHRPAWCCGLAWVVYACMKGRGGKYHIQDVCFNAAQNNKVLGFVT